MQGDGIESRTIRVANDDYKIKTRGPVPESIIDMVTAAHAEAIALGKSGQDERATPESVERPSEDGSITNAAD